MQPNEFYSTATTLLGLYLASLNLWFSLRPKSGCQTAAGSSRSQPTQRPFVVSEPTASTLTRPPTSRTTERYSRPSNLVFQEVENSPSYPPLTVGSTVFMRYGTTIQGSIHNFQDMRSLGQGAQMWSINNESVSFGGT